MHLGLLDGWTNLRSGRDTDQRIKSWQCTREGDATVRDVKAYFFSLCFTLLQHAQCALHSVLKSTQSMNLSTCRISSWSSTANKPYFKRTDLRCIGRQWLQPARFAMDCHRMEGYAN